MGGYLSKHNGHRPIHTQAILDTSVAPIFNTPAEEIDLVRLHDHLGPLARTSSTSALKPADGYTLHTNGIEAFKAALPRRLQTKLVESALQDLAFEYEDLSEAEDLQSPLRGRLHKRSQREARHLEQ